VLCSSCDWLCYIKRVCGQNHCHCTTKQNYLSTNCTIFFLSFSHVHVSLWVIWYVPWEVSVIFHVVDKSIINYAGRTTHGPVDVEFHTDLLFYFRVHFYHLFNSSSSLTLQLFISFILLSDTTPLIPTFSMPFPVIDFQNF
jgi:hypothetical protein